MKVYNKIDEERVDVIDSITATVRVLVAEDNPDVSRVLQALLEQEPGFSCVGAVGDAADVAMAVRTQHANVLLLDLGLNGVSGMDVLRECRQQFPELVVIILTGYSDPRLMREAKIQGAADFLVKPNDLDALAERIRAAVSD